MRATRVSCYKAAIVALSLLSVLPGLAVAKDFTPPASAEFPDTLNGPSADRLPPGACTDDMDFTPDANLRGPFDADTVAFHHARLPTALHAIAETDAGCQDKNRRVDHV